MDKRKKNYWYVLALTSAGPKFVTGTGEGHTCFWKHDQKPMEISKEFARSMCVGLIWNGTPAFPVCTEYEIEGQPFMYDRGEFEWKWNEQ